MTWTNTNESTLCMTDENVKHFPKENSYIEVQLQTSEENVASGVYGVISGLLIEVETSSSTKITPTRKFRMVDNVIGSYGKQ